MFSLFRERIKLSTQYVKQNTYMVKLYFEMKIALEMKILKFYFSCLYIPKGVTVVYHYLLSLVLFLRLTRLISKF